MGRFAFILICRLSFSERRAIQRDIAAIRARRALMRTPTRSAVHQLKQSERISIRQFYLLQFGFRARRTAVRIALMVNSLPESNVPDVRDYLFVDRQRVGSLLAQFADGLPESETQSKSRSKRLSANLAKIFSGQSEVGQSEAQTLALADLHVSQLEEAAQALDMLADISDLMANRKKWLRGKVRSRLQPGMLLRVTAMTQISDIATILELMSKLDQNFGSGFENAFEAMLDQIRSLYGESITVSIWPNGDDANDGMFVGELPYDLGFGPTRRELILSQVGPGPAELTTLMQISAVPTEKDKNHALGTWISELDSMATKAVENDQLDRRVLDKMIASFGLVLAHSGFVAAPKWPAISVLPLAIYRNVMPTPELDV